jgi:hypothetical protein
VKLKLRCPNCQQETTLQLAHKVSSTRLSKLFENNNICKACLKNGLGKILLNVVKFDWEEKVQSRPNESDQVPTKLDKTALSQEQINANIQRELDLQEKEKTKS